MQGLKKRYLTVIKHKMKDYLGQVLKEIKKYYICAGFEREEFSLLE